jgi:hypothetical protein
MEQFSRTLLLLISIVTIETLLVSSYVSRQQKVNNYGVLHAHKREHQHIVWQTR